MEVNRTKQLMQLLNDPIHPVRTGEATEVVDFYSRKQVQTVTKPDALFVFNEHIIVINLSLIHI